MLNQKVGSSSSKDPTIVAKELYEAIYQPDATFTLFYCSHSHDLEAVASALKEQFGDTNLIGCTSSGEISKYGYEQNSVIGLSIADDDFVSVSAVITDLNNFSFDTGQALANELLEKLRLKGKTPNPENCFGFMLIDGLAGKEEYVTASLNESLEGLQFFGGSASDGDNFANTYVYFDGAFHQNAAVVTLIHTTYPFIIFSTNHMEVLDQDFVVTEADAEKRLVKEINGLPAAAEYARLANVSSADELNTAVFSANPVLLTVEGSKFVRAPLTRVEEDSLLFACAIEEGMVYEMAVLGDLTANLTAKVSELQSQVGPIQLALGCECMCRTAEIMESDIKDDIASILQQHNFFAAVTYGEQFGGLHNNHTLVGVAIGE